VCDAGRESLCVSYCMSLFADNRQNSTYMTHTASTATQQIVSQLQCFAIPVGLTLYIWPWHVRFSSSP